MKVGVTRVSTPYSVSYLSESHHYSVPQYNDTVIIRMEYSQYTYILGQGINRQRVALVEPSISRGYTGSEMGSDIRYHIDINIH